MLKAEETVEIEPAKGGKPAKTLTKPGGLYIIGSERHESRRIDNQLRGRSGRQGDPGRSKFFLSLEDDLMRIFGSDRLDSMLQRLGLQEGEAIIHPWINKALEKAQQKVEARNFDIRKNLLKFDNVQNDQRKVIFDQRIDLMRDEDVAETVVDMRHALVDDIVSKHVPEGVYPEQWDVVGLKEELQRVLALDLPVDQWAKEEGIADEEIVERIEKRVDEHMAAKAAQWGPDVMRYVEKTLLLQTLDHLWREHLVMLDHLRQVIGLRGYGQRDPLNEYKAEAFNLFEAMVAHLREAVTAQLMRVEIVPPEQQPELPPMEAHKFDPNTGEDEMSFAAAGRFAADRACRPRSEQSDDLGQGRTQRELPLRLRQEVQALPRQVRLSVCPVMARSALLRVSRIMRPGRSEPRPHPSTPLRASSCAGLLRMRIERVNKKGETASCSPSTASIARARRAITGSRASSAFRSSPSRSSRPIGSPTRTPPMRRRTRARRRS